MLTESERKTQEAYNLRPEEFMKFAGGKDRPSYWASEMDNLMAYLGKGKSVVELGCGPATDGKYLLQAGCKSVVSVDYSKGMVNMAKDILKKEPKKPVLTVANMYDLPFKNESFDGFWATASFLHLETPIFAVSEAKRVLKPGGFGFISVKEGEGSGIDPKSGYFFRYYPRYGETSFGCFLSTSGFDYLGPKIREAPHHNWLTYIVRK